MTSLFIPRILPLPSSLIPAAPAMATAGDGPCINGSCIDDDWESRLPSPEELTPLSQSLIPPELASAFKIGPSSAAASSLLPYMEALAFHSSNTIAAPSPSPEPEKSVDDQIDSGKSRLSVDRQSNRAVAGEIGPEEELKGSNIPSQPMIFTSEVSNGRVSNSAMEKVFTEGLSGMDAASFSPSPFPYNPRERLVSGMSLPGEISSNHINRDLGMAVVRSHSSGGAAISGGAGSRSGSGGDILSMQGDAADLDSSSINVLEESPSCKEDLQVQAQAGSGARTLKKPRLVWTPQLHKRFVDAVAHLGIKNAVPKTIMQLMNVQGLTRENVASHLQKYRLYLKRMHGLSNGESMGAAGGPFSPESHLFASMPVPPSLANPTHFLLNSNINSSISFADSSPPVSASSLAPLLPGNHSSNPSLSPCLHIMNPPSFPAPGLGFDPRSFGAPSSSLATATNSLHRSSDHALHQSTAPASASDDGRVLTLFPTNTK